MIDSKKIQPYMAIFSVDLTNTNDTLMWYDKMYIAVIQFAAPIPARCLIYQAKCSSGQISKN